MKNYLDHIKKQNTGNLPVVVMDDNWCEGSSAKYWLQGKIANAKSYEKFIELVRKYYRGSEILFCHVGNYLRGEATTITIGKVN